MTVLGCGVGPRTSSVSAEIPLILHFPSVHSIVGRALSTRALLAALALLMVAPLAHAQTPSHADSSNSAFRSRFGTTVAPRANALAQEGAIDPRTYVLGPGDGFVVSVLGRIALDFPTEVDPEGYLWIQDFGRLQVAGLTLEQARQKLRERFHSDSKGLDPQLRLVRLRTFKVFVSGEVVRPGVIDASAVTRVSEAIDLAGGLLENGSRRNIVVKGRDGTTRGADLVRAERTGLPTDDPLLIDGDRVLVSRRAPGTISIYAPVSYPGGYEFRPGDRLSSLLDLAGPLRPDAVAEGAYLLRFRDDEHIDTLRVQVPPRDAAADLELQEGDRLFLPERGNYHVDRNVSLSGEVARPGIYPIREGVDRVSDLIEVAGGVTPEGNRHSVLVVRRATDSQERDPEFDRLSRLTRSEMTDNEYQTFRTKLATNRATHIVDLDLLVKNDAVESNDRTRGALLRDVVLEPGDVIFVERRGHSVQVGGEVRWPGLLAFDPALHGNDYIKLAGGYSGRARESGTRLTRAASGQTILLKDAGRIEPGDLIYVPEKNDTHFWMVVRDVIIVLGSVATIVLAFDR
jgi:polysaccharide export outer membrane protein